MNQDDMALVREFAATQSEAAFAALVQRHIGLVYSAALRQSGDAPLAEEIAQAVFILLARKAAALGPNTILPAWLYRTTRFSSANALKIQRRRQAREQEAYMQSTVQTEETNAAWQQLAPVLDDAMADLGERDRAAVVLRYFENRPWQEVAALLQVTEDAAQKRVTRALERLRKLFAKRGVTLTGTAIAGAVTTNAVQAVPATLAATITTATLAGTSLTLATVAMTTLQKIAVTAALTVTIGGGLYAAKQAHDTRVEVQTLQAQQAPLAEQIQQLTAQRDKDTSTVAGLREELIKEKKNNSELLKLRGEVGVLQRQLNESKQANSAIQSSLTSQKNPALAPDTKTTELNKCLNNLRQIDAAMQQYSLENNLSETNIVTAENILPFLQNSQIPQCLSEGTYTFGRMNEVPSCSIPGHALPPSVTSPAMELKLSSLESAIVKDRNAKITSADIKAAIQSYKQFHNGQSPQSQGEWMLYLTAYGSKYQAAMEAYLNANNSQMPTNAIDLLPYWQK